jgi:hypothetical protein
VIHSGHPPPSPFSEHDLLQVAGRCGLHVVQFGDHGRCRSAILETWTPPEPAAAATIVKERRWAEESVTYLKPLFG